MNTICLYCGGLSKMVDHQDPRRDYFKCEECDGYFISNTRTGKKHKIVDPKDIHSSPLINK